MYPPAVAALLEDGGVILLDGAQGTELERRGVQLGSSKLWSARLLVDDPDLVRAIHLDYLRAGSDVITTFTYQASLPGFAEAGIDAAGAAALLNRAVDLAEAARTQFLQEQDQQAAEGVTDSSSSQGRRRRPLIAYSCGSYGGYLADGSEFRGDYADSMTQQQLADFHRARIEPVRHRAEIDLLAFETVPCVKEAEAIVALLRQERYGKPAWISFSCRDAVHTCHGEPLAERCMPLLAAAAAEGLVLAGGVNCTAPGHVGPLLTSARARLDAIAAEGPTQAPEHLPPTDPNAQAPSDQREAATQPQEPQQQLHSTSQLLLLCYPNSGEEWDGGCRCWRHVPDDLAEPSRFGEAAREWVRGPAGLSLVGGCCRTGPEHIWALKRALR